ncbi:MAG: hypothetical protein EAX91_01030 [Candidatus Lokiarchaeota archaeon]|nr:hypothetical protein [Candidatus Lokiarchaeota archaeon]
MLKGEYSISNSKGIKQLGIVLIGTILMSFILAITLPITITQKSQENKNLGLHTQAERHISSQWLKNPTFDNPNDSWFYNIEGDNSDVNASCKDGKADFKVLGNRHSYSLIADPPLASNWTVKNNANFPNRPQVYEISNEGFRASHLYNDQTAISNPSVQWERNVSLPVYMSDYTIDMASIDVKVYANASLNIDREGDTEGRDDHVASVETYDVGDYVRFYALISDLEKRKVYEIAYFQTESLGAGNPPGEDILEDTMMESVPEDDLTFYISSVLESDHKNFTLSIGMILHFEDNIVSNWDYDKFNEVIIKSVNLTFGYSKKIDQSTAVSWNQIGNSIMGERIEIESVSLSFKYKIDSFWSSDLSLNSKMQILINNYDCGYFIKLSSFNTTYKDFRIEGTEINPYILKNINISLSIQVFIGDEFLLTYPFTISIDDIYFQISYTLWVEDEIVNNDFIWIVLIISFIVIGLLAALSLRSYVLLPRQQRKKSYLILRTQKFKDVRNLQAIIAMHKPSGLPIYSQSYSSIMKGKKTLFSGFIQAVSIIGEEMTRSDKQDGKKKKSKDKIDFHKVIELDLKQFYCLVLDVEELRTVLILKSKSSKRLKEILVHFSFGLYVKISDRLKNWDNDLNNLDEIIRTLVYEYFDIYYKDPFSVNIEESELMKYKKKLNLSKFEFQIMNIIFMILKEKSHFKLMDILERETDKDEDQIISALESLIEFKLIRPIK